MENGEIVDVDELIDKFHEEISQEKDFLSLQPLIEKYYGIELLEHHESPYNKLKIRKK